MKRIHNTLKDIINLFNTLRFFFDKMPDRSEYVDYGSISSKVEALKHFRSTGVFFYYVADLQKLKISDVGGSLYQLTGLHPQNVIGRNFAFALKMFYIQEIPDVLKGMIKYHQYIYCKPIEERLLIKGSLILRVKNKSGGNFTGLLQAVPLAVDAKGHVTHMYSSITDITHFNVEPNSIKGDIIDESDPDNIKVINILNKNLNLTWELTNAELRILKLISEGKSTKEISDILFLSEHTINNHRKNMIHKTHAKNTAELISKTLSANQY